MAFVIRQIMPPGLSARADEATAEALADAAIRGTGVVKGAYLEWSNPDGRNGFGDDRWTLDRNRAKRFATYEAAFECWRAQSRVNPFRSDGMPNRPMTAYSV